VATQPARTELAAVKLWLVDTGPVVAYLDADDPDHARVGATIDGFSGRAITTPAVITEAMYFAGGTRGGARALAELVDRSGMAVYDVCQPSDLRAAAGLMDQYADTPMDYADATLVLLAEVLEVFDILTLDRRGFSTYRTVDGHPFRMVLDTD
jgi:predicted nucleic acid-binding protein